jgi:hypothetical protein
LPCLPRPELELQRTLQHTRFVSPVRRFKGYIAPVRQPVTTLPDSSGSTRHPLRPIPRRLRLTPDALALALAFSPFLTRFPRIHPSGWSPSPPALPPCHRLCRQHQWLTHRLSPCSAHRAHSSHLASAHKSKAAARPRCLTDFHRSGPPFLWFARGLLLPPHAFVVTWGNQLAYAHSATILFWPHFRYFRHRISSFHPTTFAICSMIWPSE